MFATERNSSICVKSIQRNSSSTNPHLPMANGDFSMHFSHDFAFSFRRTSPLPCNIANKRTHTIFDHGLQMGIAPCFGVLGNVPTLRPRFSHFPPPLCRGALLRIIASPRRSTKNPPQTHQGLRGHTFILCRCFFVVRCSAHALFIQCLDALGQYRHCAM